MSESKFINSLINETSPYLLQHAHNPVEWFAWGEEALNKAKIEDKPIFLSIGYAACHWCHVMEHESFEDERTAKLMNDNFVCIKVDREERPDIDQIYMNFVQLSTGSGGWPLSAFLTSDAVPFFGGTYFPPVDRYNMPSFPRILISVAEAYREKRADILQSSKQILSDLGRVGKTESSSVAFSTTQLDTAFQGLSRSYDPTNGGFGGAPKFPPAMTLEFCLKQFARTKNETALEIVVNTCRKMACGGMYDQIGGGFHRYSVDSVWLVPHFEKMLYDNAQLAKLYLHVFQVTKDDFFKRIAIEILEYVKREMLDEKGGFYAAQDADSEGVEGKFFVWTPREVAEILGESDAEIFNGYFDITDDGNFEGENIPHVSQTIEDSARRLSVSVERLNAVLERGQKLLFDVRENRIKPMRDEKVLTAWNGLMLTAFAEASAILESDDYREIAIRNADFVLNNMRGANGLLLRTYKDGQAKLNAYLEDYAFFADGLLELYQASGEVRWLKEAVNLTDTMIKEFWDKETGGFYFTGESHENLIVRSKEYFDNATPSGNSVAADVLLKLAILTGNEDYSRYATALFRLISNSMRQYPSAFGRGLCAFDFYLNSPKEIVVVGNDGNPLLREVWKRFIANKVVVVASEENNDADLIPLLQNRRMIDGKATAYVCENFACRQPVTDVADFAAQLEG
ncbi:MAG: thioredoxin domain-containing protein [Pyrinomonadaceae bacterium]|nr:thioredoxin domain-containing protein [Pyrinomonadaceae bacterium]